MNKIKLTALPCICADVFYGTDIIRPGGEALNFAAHASHFKNVDVTLLGIVGKDNTFKGKKLSKCRADSGIAK
jgi:fructoselysine 6-kinase